MNEAPWLLHKERMEGQLKGGHRHPEISSRERTPCRDTVPGGQTAPGGPILLSHGKTVRVWEDPRWQVC